MTKPLASVTQRLAALGGEKWTMHSLAKQHRDAGQLVLDLTIGEPDVPTPPELVDVATKAMRNGRTGYSDGRGEARLLDALAQRYSQRLGQDITTDRLMCFPGTQSALYTVFRALVENNQEVLLGDPMYATYEGVIASAGGQAVGVPLHARHGFRLQVDDVAARITPASRVLFLNTPHNPTGAILSQSDLDGLSALAVEHDLWIVADEVYEDLVFDNARFVSPLQNAALADRVIVVSSISKSHAAAGFRSGWCVAPVDFCRQVLPLSETMLFGNQPFIADMTAAAVSSPSAVAADMRQRFHDRARYIHDALHGQAGLEVHQPQAGMFVLVNIGCTGLHSLDYARELLHSTQVAVMPGSSFGRTLDGWIRLSLSTEHQTIHTACERIRQFTQERLEQRS